MAKIVLDGVTKVFGSDVVAVDDVSLEMADGEFMVLVGPSGCGKSTILRLLAGLEDLTAGEIFIDGDQVSDLPPKERDIAMVFQNYALYPHMTVEQNLGFGLKLRKEAREESRKRVREVAEILKLEPLMQRKPVELSGGQRQRVAIGRAMVRNPRAFLMDEPLSNLDAKLRVQMRAELTRLHTRLRATTVYVTHDQVEAMTLGDRVAVLKDGVLQQVATPQELYHSPVNLFVAAFIGSPPMNLVEARVDERRVSFAGFEIPVPDNVDLSAVRGRSVILGIRPSDFEDTAVWRTESLPVIDVTAEVTEELGSEVNVLFRVNAPPVATEETIAAASVEGDEDALIPLIAEEEEHAFFCARVDARTKARAGAPLTLTVDPSRFYYFDRDSGKRLGGGGLNSASASIDELALQSPEREP
jgi:multiple sugar transport system ATP-binding protein